MKTIHGLHILCDWCIAVEMVISEVKRGNIS